MKLYVTPTSPYARLALIVRLEKNLSERVVLIWTRTRDPDDPILAVNPSGRFPFLLLDDGTGYEDSDVIVEYLDSLASPRQFTPPAGFGYWPYRRAQAMARSLLDGVSVWAREIIRPETEQSPGILVHERARAGRLAGYFESQVSDPILSGKLNIAQLLLFCALDIERRVLEFDWRTGNPGLIDWHAGMLDQPSVRASLPPEGV